MVKLLLIIRDDFLFFVIMISFGLLFYGLNVSIDIGEFRLFFLIFFLLGILLKHLSVQYNNIFAGRWILLSFSAVIVALYKCGISFEFYALYLRLPLVMLICCTSVLSFVNCDSLRSRVLSYLGRHSLEIYLWHVIPILMIKQIIPEDRSIVYYVFTFGLLALLLLGVWFLQKSSLRRK